MTRDETLKELQSVFHSVFNDTDVEIDYDMTAHDYEPWDSLNHIGLIVQTERHFKIKLLNAEVARLENIGDLVDIVVKKSRR